ncbi:membrane protein insertion efficiency factor YidD [Patescibacteria group bacterium]|nr:membrane protein insertion efficiency factor YidD [Patescibacteria group bacterium]
MTKIAILLINFYQMFLSTVFKNLLGGNAFCKYSPTCSVFSKTQIKKKGLIKGGAASIARLTSCRNF